MKKLLLILTLFLAVFASCSKDKQVDPAAQAAKDEADIQAYLKANPDINATKDENGVYYQILTQGGGANPTVSNTVTVNYVGKLLNGSQFDAGSSKTFALANVIKGWQYGIPHVKTGGRILLIVPSALGYGTLSPDPSVPANSVLVFTVDLLSVK